MARRYRSKPLTPAHETALGLRDAGVIDKRAMKAFDAMCLTPGGRARPKVTAGRSSPRKGADIMKAAKARFRGRG